MRGFFTLLLLCSSATAHDLASTRGEVALEHTPFCEFFVVHTERGFSLLDWRGGQYVIAEGDDVLGPLHSLGVQTITIAGEAEMRAMVEEWGVNLLRAQSAFYRRCKVGSNDPRQMLPNLKVGR